MTHVGRPKEYDREAVLDAAMDAFWSKGYEATSVNDLVEATGMHKGSLYKAFGDKHALFCTALEHYFDTMYQFKNSMLESGETPTTGLMHSCREMLFPENYDPENDPPKGCMAVNAIVELGPHDKDVERIIENHFAKTAKIVARTLQEAEKAGEMKLTNPPEVSAMMLMTFMAGLATVTKGPVSKEQAESLVYQQFKLLGLK